VSCKIIVLKNINFCCQNKFIWELPNEKVDLGPEIDVEDLGA
jgi:hypothetical protein